MSQIKKMRPSPAESATLFPIGTKKVGNDGNVWIIKKNINGTHRWAKMDEEQKISKSNTADITKTKTKAR